MALIFSDRVKDTTVTSGTGTITLSGTAPTGYQTFGTGVGNANTCYYCIASQTLATWEVGLGTYTSAGTTLSRTAGNVLSGSSGAGTLVSFGSETKDVFVTSPALWATSPSYTGTLTANGSLVANSTVTLDPANAAVDISPTGTGTVTISPAGALTINPTAASTINNTSIGVTTAAAGRFTTITSTSTVTLSPASANVAISPTGTGTVAISPAGALTINPTAASTLDNTAVGATTAATGRFTGVTVTAGTASVAPILLTSGTNLTTATAGSIEYDGTVGYFTSSSSSRSVLMSEQIQTLTSTYTLTSQIAAQKLFNATTNGAITLPIGTYEFECSYSLLSMSSTSGSFGFALGGTATFTQYWEAHALKPASLTTASAPSMTYNTAAANTTLVTASVNTTGYAKITGIIRVSVAGTVIPQVSLGVAAAAVVDVGSYFKIRKMGSSSVTNIGNWS